MALWRSVISCAFQPCMNPCSGVSVLRPEHPRRRGCAGYGITGHSPAEIVEYGVWPSLQGSVIPSLTHRPLEPHDIGLGRGGLLRYLQSYIPKEEEVQNEHGGSDPVRSPPTPTLAGEASPHLVALLLGLDQAGAGGSTTGR